MADLSVVSKTIESGFVPVSFGSSNLFYVYASWCRLVCLVGSTWWCGTWQLAGLLFLKISSHIYCHCFAIDAFFVVCQGCTILSGDVIIRHLASHMKPEYVVFLVSFVNGLIQYPVPVEKKGITSIPTLTMHYKTHIVLTLLTAVSVCHLKCTILTIQLLFVSS